MRLSDATLDRLPASVARPGYDRRAVTAGVVHLGLGAFHRAHQALVFEQALAAGDMRWGVTGVSLRSPDMRDRLDPQDRLYTVTVRDGSGETTRAVGAMRRCLVAPEAPAAVLAALAARATQLVTLTVTEKGYGLDPATGRLRRDEQAIAADLASLAAPRSAVGFLVAGLAARRRAGLPPFTTLSCDNLPGNGALLGGAVLELAEVHDTSLARWIADEGAFPASMVDRIVPAASPAALSGLTDRIGVEDAAAVFTEPFCQWVVEDRFCGPRPDLAAFGVQLTDRVAPWEEAKLRLLNGAHSAMAYLGGLAGIEHVHDFIAAPARRQVIEALWDENAATLSPPPGLDLAEYRRSLLARFANPALAHRLVQIAADGSQKLPQRLVAPFAERIARGEPADALALAIAGWIVWQRGRLDDGGAIEVSDPMAIEMAARARGAADGPTLVAALLSIDEVFPPILAADPRARAAIVQQTSMLLERGAAGAMAHLIED